MLYILHSLFNCNKRAGFLIWPFTDSINLTKPFLLLKLYLKALAPATGLRLPPNLCNISYNAPISLISTTIYKRAYPVLDKRNDASPSINPANHSLNLLLISLVETVLNLNLDNLLVLKLINNIEVSIKRMASEIPTNLLTVINFNY